MHNHIQNNTQHQFCIHGGDKRGTNYLLYVAVGMLPIVGAAIWFLGDLGLWIGVGGYVFALVTCVGWMGSGKAERYEIRIDTDEGTIVATDRVSGVQLWEDDFHPAWIRLSDTSGHSGKPISIPRWCTEEPLDGHGCRPTRHVHCLDWEVVAVESVQIVIGDLPKSLC